MQSLPLIERLAWHPSNRFGRRPSVLFVMLITFSMAVACLNEPGEHELRTDERLQSVVVEGGATCGPTTIDLLAGRDDDVGDVTFSIEGEDIVIKVELDAPWMAEESHTHCAAEPSGIPSTRNGNLVPGQADYHQVYDDPVSGYTVVIPLSETGVSTCPAELYCFVHAMVGDGYRTETAVGDGDIRPGRNWFTISTFGLPDDTAPQIFCPADLTLECSADTSPGNTGYATATDDCSGVGVAHTDAFTQVCGSAGVVERTWAATDECGNASFCDQVITIVDTEEPTISCPADATVECGGSTEPANTGSATASDACEGALTPSFVDVAEQDSIFRTWTAEDGCGNESSCEQRIDLLTCCGNGTIEEPEECDDGNSISGDGCENDCTWTACVLEAAEEVPANEATGNLDPVDITDYRCPPGQALVGLEGRSGLVMDQLVYWCAPLQPDCTAGADLSEIAPPHGSSPGGDVEFGPYYCGADEFITKLDLRIGDGTDLIQGRCRNAEDIGNGASNESYTSSTQEHGNPEGGIKTQTTCPTGYVAVGVRGGERQWPPWGWPNSFQLICQRVRSGDTVDSFQLGASETRSEEVFGNLDAGNVGDYHCPEGEVLAGFEGNSGYVIDHLIYRCRSLLPNGALGIGGKTSRHGSSPGGEVSFGPNDCPVDQGIVRLDLYIGDGTDSIQGACRTIENVADGASNGSEDGETEPAAGTAGGGDFVSTQCLDGQVAVGVYGGERQPFPPWGWPNSYGLICRPVTR